MTPEEKARELIDDQLGETGWAVQSADEMNITAARGVAVREFPLKTGFADYLLYGDCKSLGTKGARMADVNLVSLGSRYVRRVGGHYETTTRIPIED